MFKTNNLIIVTNIMVVIMMANIININVTLPSDVGVVSA